MPAWQSVGPHRFYVDGNLFGMELNGPVTVPDIAALLSHQEALLLQFDVVLTLCDARHAVMPTPEVRRFLADRGKRIDTARLYAVVITDSVLLRTIVQLIEHAARILTGAPPHTTFVKDEPEALAWIQARRKARL